MLFIGYFEGIDSQRGIDWRCNDSLSLHEFLGVALTEQTPDHSTLTRTRKRLPLEIHEQVFEGDYSTTGWSVMAILGTLRCMWSCPFREIR